MYSYKRKHIYNMREIKSHPWTVISSRFQKILSKFGDSDVGKSRFHETQTRSEELISSPTFHNDLESSMSSLTSSNFRALVPPTSRPITESSRESQKVLGKVHIRLEELAFLYHKFKVPCPSSAYSATSRD